VKIAEPCGCFPAGRHYPGIAHLMGGLVAGVAGEYDAKGPWAEMPLVLLDVETTGTDATTDRIVEVGAVLGLRGEVVGRWGRLVNPGRPIPDEVTRVHGIRDADVADAPSFAELAEELLAFLGDAIPAAYNAHFDRGFILAELERTVSVRQLRSSAPTTRPGPGEGAGDEEPLRDPPVMRRDVDWLDPLAFARELQKGESSRSLGDVAARMDIEAGRAHRATDDAETALRILYAFAGDARVPSSYGGLVQEQRRLIRQQAEARKAWQK